MSAPSPPSGRRRAGHRPRRLRHWVAEQAPEQLLAALTTFLAPYRDGPAGSTSTSST